MIEFYECTKNGIVRSQIIPWSMELRPKNVSTITITCVEEEGGVTWLVRKEVVDWLDKNTRQPWTFDISIGSFDLGPDQDDIAMAFKLRWV